MTNVTFYKLQDPFTEETKYVGATKLRLQEELKLCIANAMNNKEKSDTDLWILELMDKKRSPLMESLGQRKVRGDYEINKGIKEFEEKEGLQTYLINKEVDEMLLKEYEEDVRKLEKSIPKQEDANKETTNKKEVTEVKIKPTPKKKPAKKRSKPRKK